MKVELTQEQERIVREIARQKGIRPEDAARLMLECAFTPTLTPEQAMALYAARAVSQGRAAELAGLSRAAFLEALAAAGVSPFQYTAEEALEEAGIA